MGRPPFDGQIYAEWGGGVALSHYITQNGRRLRCGFTTGSCAALAAGAAARMLLNGREETTAALVTPSGVRVQADLQKVFWDAQRARCAVQKDAGDDIDATDGLLIFAEVTRTVQPGFAVRGGEGIGRVTLPGLEQPVGEWAINRVPRQMIADALREAAAQAGYDGGLCATIFCPQGLQAAQRTFNARLGIVGGISILGTAGIVEPQSIRALLDTIELEIRQLAARGLRRILLAPGNYGVHFAAQHPQLRGLPVVKCANFIGDALDFAAAQGIEQLLLVSHIGKAVKLAGGIMNTHSRIADCRAELFCAHAALCGAPVAVLRDLMQSVTTEQALCILQRAGCCEATVQSLLAAIDTHLQARAAGAFALGALVFRNEDVLLGATPSATALLEQWERENV